MTENTYICIEFNQQRHKQHNTIGHMRIDPRNILRSLMQGMALGAICISCLTISCITGNTNNELSRQDSILYDNICEYREQDNIPSIISESEKFLATPRAHTTRLDMEVMYDLAFYKVCNKEQKEAMDIVLRGSSLAKAQNDPIMESLFHYQMGRFISMDNPERGIPYMREGAKMLQDYMCKTSDRAEQIMCASRIANIHMNLLNYCSNISNDTIYLEALNDFNQHVDLCQREQIDQNMQKLRMLQKFFTLIYYTRIGNKKKAQEIYAEFMKSDLPKDEYFVLDMQLKLGYYSHALQGLEKIAQYYRETDDRLELNENYLYIIESLVTCYDSLGMEAQAESTREEVYQVKNAITLHHHNQELQELNAKYNLQSTEIELKKATYRKHIYGILAIFFGLIGSFGYWGFVHTRRRNRLIKAKNIVLARQLNEALDASKEKFTQEEVVYKEEENTFQEMDRDTRNVHRFIHELTTRKLFCNANFDRDELLNELGIPKKTFAHCFEAVTSDNCTHYLLKLRLEHAAELIRNHPNFTIDSIAQDSGFASRSTFYRNFSGQYGISPAEFRLQCLEQEG